jgi:hypothetical protein
MQRQISITIDPVGRPKIEAIGFNGQGCETATKGLEQALGGGNVSHRDLKPEYTNTETDQQIQQGW